MGNSLCCCSPPSSTRSPGVCRYKSKGFDTESIKSEPVQPSQRERSYSDNIVTSYSTNFDQGLESSHGLQLECFIIPSFGKDPPENVAVKKMAGDFLRGVGDDFKSIQNLVEKDNQKELVNVQLMCHFEQVKLADFIVNIEERMKDLKIKSTAKGLLIWYTGHGERDTGNWVMEDGNLQFENIYDLYMKYFKGRYLYIVTDCCYSGAWVVECARLLDRDGIKCGHDAKLSQIYIKIFAACLPNEEAYDKFYTECKGVKLQPNGASRTVVFAEHRSLEDKSRTSYQTTLGVDFTQTNECIKQEDGNCIHCRTSMTLYWTKLVQRLTENQHSGKYLE